MTQKISGKEPLRVFKPHLTSQMEIVEVQQCTQVHESVSPCLLTARWVLSKACLVMRGKGLVTDAHSNSPVCKVLVPIYSEPELGRNSDRSGPA